MIMSETESLWNEVENDPEFQKLIITQLGIIAMEAKFGKDFYETYISESVKKSTRNAEGEKADLHDTNMLAVNMHQHGPLIEESGFEEMFRAVHESQSAEQLIATSKDYGVTLAQADIDKAKEGAVQFMIDESK
jgi:hypothetical protein